MDSSQRRWLFFVIFILSIFWIVGISFFDSQHTSQHSFETLMNSTASDSIERYYGQILGPGERLSLVYDGDERIVWCLEGSVDGVKTSQNQQCSSKEIIIDEHAASLMVHGSYNIKTVMVSEFLRGHIKIRGVSFSDMVGWI